MDGKAVGYLNESGAMTIKPAYEGGGDFSEGLASVRIGGKSGYVDRSGHLAIALNLVTQEPLITVWREVKLMANTGFLITVELL